MIKTKIVPLLFRNGILNLFKKSGSQFNWSLCTRKLWSDFPVFHTLVSTKKLKFIFRRGETSLTSAEKLPIMSFIVFIWLAFVKWIFWDIVISSLHSNLDPYWIGTSIINGIRLMIQLLNPKFTIVTVAIWVRMTLSAK